MSKRSRWQLSISNTVAAVKIEANRYEIGHFFQVEENRGELTCLHKKSRTEFPRVQVSILCRVHYGPASSLKLLIHTTSITASDLNPRASSHEPSFIQTEDTPYWKRNQFLFCDKMLPLHPQLFISIMTHL